MKEIILKRLRLLNFKGIRDLEVEFDEDATIIQGRNGLGKSTVFDAFCWLLFGKNSDERKDFNIKTLDADGNVIPRIPHEVEAELTVNGQELKLMKSYNEKWVKQRGSAVEEFKGHDTVCSWNDVPLKNSEFNAKIVSEICDEDVFKMLTSPYYFTSLKTESQRAALFKIAGALTDVQIAGGNEDFTQLLKSLNGKSLDEFKKEVGAKKKAIKQDIESLPARIDERWRDISTVNAPSMSEKEIKEDLDKAQKEISDIDRKLQIPSEMMRAQEEEAAKRGKAIFDLKSRIDKRKRDIEKERMDIYYEIANKNTRLKQEISNLEMGVQQNEERISHLAEYVASLETASQALRERWYEENARQLVFSESDFVCPICKRPFDLADVEAKKAEMTANFNAGKAKKLAEISAEGKKNKALIEAKKEEIRKIEEQIEGQKTEHDKKIDQIVDGVKAPDIEKAVSEDSEIKRMEAEIEKIREEAEKETKAEKGDGKREKLEAKKEELQKKADELKGWLKEVEFKTETMKRIRELEEKLSAQNQALADLEKTEFTMQEFSKARTTALEDNINSLFKHVRFKMFDKQINGGEVETCVATVDGVPYPDLNTAGKVNAGLDIVRAFVNAYEIYAPVFVDNAESINRVSVLRSQMILLKVSEDEKLTIK